jgi:FkbM family methyltransferase
MSIKVRWIDGFPVKYRPDTTDEKVLKEVVDKHCYRKVRSNFDVEPGEVWLDLGANIGAFAVYCKVMKATAVCYEPDPKCFELLKFNAKGFEIFNTAVTSSKDSKIEFFSSKNTKDNYRGSVIKTKTAIPQDSVNNIWCGELTGSFDGIKMDIEGSEFGLLDDDLLPDCKKLCLEYHTKRDSSVDNLSRRINYLKDRFDHLSYPPELDRLIEAGVDANTYFDRLIFCWND